MADPLDPFDYVVGPSRAEILARGRKYGIKFILPIDGMAEWSDKPIFGQKNPFTKVARSVQHGLIWGFNTRTHRDVVGQDFYGLSVSFKGRSPFKESLELQNPDWARQYSDVGVTKRGIVDYLDKFKEHDLFKWAQERTMGYSNWQDVFKSSQTIREWEEKHGQKIADAVFKTNEGAKSKGVFFGLENVPASLKGNKDLIVQPRLNIIKEYGVVHVANEAVDITYRFGSPELQRFTKKTGLKYFFEGLGVESGLPELLQPVLGKEAQEVKFFAERISQTLPYKIGRMDIARIGPGIEGLRLIEAQKKFGNMSLPWVRQKIEYALTGKIPSELKMLAGAGVLTKVGIGVVGAMLFKKHLDKKKGSNDEPINKIVGHHPGRMNSQVEDDIRSDFTAGKSYDPKPGSPSDSNGFYIYRSNADRNDYNLTGAAGFAANAIDDVIILSALVAGGTLYGAARGLGSGIMSGVKGMVGSRVFKKGVVSIALSASLFTASPSQAHNVIPTRGEASVAKSSEALRKRVDYVAGLYTTDPVKRKNAADMLYETAVHESDLLRYRRQVITSKGKRVEKGVGRSIFMVEPTTAKDLVSWAGKKPKAMKLLTSTSGLTKKKLLSMSKDELANYLMSHDHFAAAMARLRYVWAPGAIPSTKGERAKYWSKYYQTKNDPALTKKFLNDNRIISEELKAASLSKVVKKHIPRPGPTQNVVGNLHKTKVMHNVASKAKKYSNMKKILRAVK